jgi:methionyl-tRNA synthetase
MLVKYRAVEDGSAPVPEVPSGVETATQAAIMVEKWRTQMAAYDLSGALETIWVYVRSLNRLVEERAPWKLAKDESQSMMLDATLGELVEGLLAVCYALSPVMPSTTTKIAATFGLTADELARWSWGIAAGRKVSKPEPLFPRLETSTPA